MPKKIKKLHTMYVRREQLGFKRRRPYRTNCLSGVWGYCGPYHEDEQFHAPYHVLQGENVQSKASLQLFYYKRNYSENEKDGSSTDEDEDFDAFSIDESCKDFEDTIENELYWSCDEEELEVYSAFEDSDDEDSCNGDCMSLYCGNTLLHRSEKDYTTKRFLYLNYDVNATDCFNETPLCTASLLGNLDIVKTLLSAGANINIRNTLGQDLLTSSINRYANMKIVHELLNWGADYSSVMDFFQEEAMHHAYNKELVLEFLKRGAKINVMDRYGYFPIHHASRRYDYIFSLSAAQELIQNGADVNCLDLYHKTPLYHTIVGKRWDVMRELMLNGAELDKPCTDKSFPTGKCTALEKALQHNRTMAQLLIKLALLLNFLKGLDFNSIDKYFLNDYDSKLEEDLTNNCANELSLMKKHIIANCTLFGHMKTLIVKKKIKPLYVDYDIHAEIKKNFPLYCEIILPKIEACQLRAESIAKIKQTKISFSSKENDGVKSVELNYDCILLICEHLSEEDLSALISAL